MSITEDKNQMIFSSRDSRGRFEIRIHKDCLEMQLETDVDDENGWNEEMYVHINYEELIEIRNMIDMVINYPGIK